MVSYIKIIQENGFVESDITIILPTFDGEKIKPENTQKLYELEEKLLWILSNYITDEKD